LFLNKIYFNKLNSDLKNKDITQLEAIRKTKEFKESINRMHKTIVRFNKIETNLSYEEDQNENKNYSKHSRGNIAITIIYSINILLILITIVFCLKQ